MILNYVLDENGNPVPEPDIRRWGEWLEKADRTILKEKVGEYEVSTVFLGLDHAFNGGTPILWETMIFGWDSDDDLNGYQRRYTSRVGALKGHKETVQMLKDTIEKQPGWTWKP